MMCLAAGSGPDKVESGEGLKTNQKVVGYAHGVHATTGTVLSQSF